MLTIGGEMVLPVLAKLDALFRAEQGKLFQIILNNMMQASHKQPYWSPPNITVLLKRQPIASIFTGTPRSKQYIHRGILEVLQQES